MRPNPTGVIKPIEKEWNPTMHLNVDNRWDKEKYAHPEASSDGNYLLPGVMEYTMSYVHEPREVRIKKHTEWCEMIRAAQLSDERLETLNYEFRIVNTTCPEEPDAPPFEICITTPKDRKEGEILPVIYNIPGGGLYQGGSVTQMLNTYNYNLCSTHRAVVVTSTYRNALDSEYPAAINDIHACYLWIIDNLKELGGDPKHILLWGMSTGGHLVLSLAFRLKRYDYHGVRPCGIISGQPVMDDVLNDPSGHISLRNPETGIIDGWDSESVRWSMRMWLGDHYGDAAIPPEAVPARAKLADVIGFPPTWFPCVPESDPNRDAAVKFAQLLQEAGVFCDLHVWGGISHHFHCPAGAPLIDLIQSVIDYTTRVALQYDFWRNDDLQ